MFVISFFAWFVTPKKQPLNTTLPLSYSQLSDPWDANQNGNFVTNIRCVVLVVTVVPACRIDARSKNVGHPNPESLGVSHLKICKKKLNKVKNRQPSVTLQL